MKDEFTQLGDAASGVLANLKTKFDQWAYWRDALAGKLVDTEIGNPRSGYWRNQMGTGALAIWRAGDELQWETVNTRSFRDADEVDEAFASMCRYPLSYELFDTMRNGGALPPEYKTHLTLKEIQAGVAWTPELGRKKLGADLEGTDTPENPRAVMGGNNPPEEMPIERQFMERIATAAKRVEEWLASIGGSPRTKEEADKVADYASRFGELHSKADEAFRAEKQPWLDGGRVVDAKWKFRDEAIAYRKTYLGLASKWIDGEKARLAAEAKKAHEEAVAAAKREADALGEPAPVIEAPEPPKVTVGNTRAVSQRTRKVWIVKDPKAFVSYLMALDTTPPDLVEAYEKIAQRIGSAGIKAPGIEQEERRSAA